ncbi:MAG TPA: TIGR03435 family protein [Bryobacteraceae bacterium]
MFSGNTLKGADDPKFEVASLKRVEACAMRNSEGPGRISFNGDPLKVLLAEAFAVKAGQISGPSWLDTDCFTIIATLPEGATKDQIPAMLRALFAERLKLSSHKDSRPQPGYVLVVDKNGPKVKPSGQGPNAAPAGQVRFEVGGRASIKGAITMAFLARYLSTRLGSPVADLTQMKGTYDVDLAWAPQQGLEATPPLSNDPGNSTDDPSLGSIFTAIRESLGLRLEPRKEGIEVFVIDHIERLPIEN